jgi:hypothetical protein
MKASVFSQFPSKREGSFPWRISSSNPPAGIRGGLGIGGDGGRGNSGEGGLIGGVGILRGTGATVPWWIGIGIVGIDA